MTLFGENYNSAEFMLGLITRAEHCAGYRHIWPSSYKSH